MKKIKTSLQKSLLILFFALGACANLNQQGNLPKVRTGQSQAEVVKEIGEPESKSFRDSTDVWHYEIYSFDGTHIYPYLAFFRDGHLTDFQFDAMGNKEVVKPAGASGGKHRGSKGDTPPGDGQP